MGVHLLRLLPATPDDPAPPRTGGCGAASWPSGSPAFRPSAGGWPPALDRPRTTTRSSPPPPPPAPHRTAHVTPSIHWEVVGRACLQPGMLTRITAMSDSDGPPQRDNRHHRRSRPRFPVSPRCTGETPAEREERLLAQAAVPVGLPAEQPKAAPYDTEPLAPEPAPAGEAAPAAQAAAPAAPPPGGPRMRKGPQPPPLPAAPRPLGRRRRNEQALRGPRVHSRGPARARRKARRAPSTAPTPSPATPT